MGDNHPVFRTDTSRWPLISWIVAYGIYYGFIFGVAAGGWFIAQALLRWLGQ